MITKSATGKQNKEIQGEPHHVALHYTSTLK